MALSSNVRGRWGLWNEAKVGEGAETGIAVSSMYVLDNKISSGPWPYVKSLRFPSSEVRRVVEGSKEQASSP